MFFLSHCFSCARIFNKIEVLKRTTTMCFLWSEPFWVAFVLFSLSYWCSLILFYVILLSSVLHQYDYWNCKISTYRWLCEHWTLFSADRGSWKSDCIVSILKERQWKLPMSHFIGNDANHYRSHKCDRDLDVVVVLSGILKFSRVFKQSSRSLEVLTCPHPEKIVIFQNLTSRRSERWFETILWRKKMIWI